MVRERARLSAGGTTDGSGLAGTMPPSSNPLPPQQHAQRGGRGKSEGHRLAEPLDRLIQSCCCCVLKRDRKREQREKGGRNTTGACSGRAKEAGIRTE